MAARAEGQGGGREIEIYVKPNWHRSAAWVRALHGTRTALTKSGLFTKSRVDKTRYVKRD